MQYITDNNHNQLFAVPVMKRVYEFLEVVIEYSFHDSGYSINFDLIYFKLTIDVEGHGAFRTHHSNDSWRLLFVESTRIL